MRKYTEQQREKNRSVARDWYLKNKEKRRLYMELYKQTDAYKNYLINKSKQRNLKIVEQKMEEINDFLPSGYNM